MSPHARGANAIERTTAARRLMAPFMLAALAALILGLWAGLARIGWAMPGGGGNLMLRHGALMVVGFAGTVIAVERAVAMQSAPAFVAPALSAAAGIALIVAAPMPVAPAFAAAAAAAYSLSTAILLARHRLPPFIVALAGGLCLAVAAAVWWHDDGLRRVVPWWMTFLVLTIAAERLELIRFQRFSLAALASGALVLFLLALGSAVTLTDFDIGTRLLGAGLLGGPLWLVRRDVARHTVRTEGVARFAAAGILTAYGWLAVAGLLAIAGGVGAGLRYDALVHAFFIGFVFSAIIAHEPIILPALTGFRFRYTPLLYAPLVMLEGTLVLRIGADLFEADGLRRWMGMVQALAIVLFLLLSAASVAAGQLGRRPTSRGRVQRRPAG